MEPWKWQLQRRLTAKVIVFDLALILFFGISNKGAYGAAAATSGLCRSSCGNVAVRYPFGIDDGCGAPEYRGMFTCDDAEGQGLQFHTVSGTYSVQNIDYEKQRVVIYSAHMTTCNALQPRQDFRMDEVQSVLIPPSPDTIFFLLNCSSDSPILHRYSSLCANISGKSCDKLYSCPALNVLLGVPVAPQPPPCCSTDFKTIAFLSLDVLDCSHYTAIYNAEQEKSDNPEDWQYGIELSYSVPDTHCNECQHTQGTCGYNTETLGMLCICGSMNTTRDCGGSLSRANPIRWQLLAALPLLLLHFILCSTFEI